MAKKFLTPVRPPALSSDPAVGPEGSIYYNSSSKKLRLSDGTSWQDLVGSGGGGSTTIEVRDTPPLSPTEGTIYYNTQERTFKGYNGIIWFDVAGPKELIDHVHYTDGYVRNADYGNYVDLGNYIVSMDGGNAFTNYSSAPNDDIIYGGNAYGN